MEQVDLIDDGVHVGGAGDVAAGGVIVLDQAGGGEVGDGGADDGDVGGGTRHGLGGGGGDREDKVAALVHERARDGLAGGLVVLGVLQIDLRADTGLFHRGDEALVGGIECGVLGELQDADLEGGVRRGGTIGLGGGVAASGEAETADDRECGGAGHALDKRATRAGGVVHGDSPNVRTGRMGGIWD